MSNIAEMRKNIARIENRNRIVIKQNIRGFLIENNSIFLFNLVKHKPGNNKKSEKTHVNHIICNITPFYSESGR